jgi:hypothetical protein
MIIRDETARSLIVPLLIVLAASLVACGGGGESPGAGGDDGTAADATPATGEFEETRADDRGATTIAGVTFAPPASWEDLGPSGMRQAQYRLARREGDDAPAEVNVFYFGPASGGGVEANLQRWIGQIEAAAGEQPTRSQFTADGMAGHVVSLDGTYDPGGSRPMGGSAPPRPGYRLVGVVLEGPEGSLFFKLTGPAATARAMEADLLTMVKAARRAG